MNIYYVGTLTQHLHLLFHLSKQPSKVGKGFFPISWMRKLKLREVK